jgi:hypothetical protein
MDLNLLLFVAFVSSLLGASVLSYLELVLDTESEWQLLLKAIVFPLRLLLLLVGLLALLLLGVQAELV